MDKVNEEAIQRCDLSASELVGQEYRTNVDRSLKGWSIVMQIAVDHKRRYRSSVLLLCDLVTRPVLVRIVHNQSPAERAMVLKWKTVEDRHNRDAFSRWLLAESHFQVERDFLEGAQSECRLCPWSKEHDALRAEKWWILPGRDLCKKTLDDPSGHFDESSVVKDFRYGSLIETLAAEFLHEPLNFGVSLPPLRRLSTEPELHLEAYHRVDGNCFLPIPKDACFGDTIRGAPTADVTQQLKEVFERAEALLRSLGRVLSPFTPQG